jgi:hypothetical protein
MGGGLGNDPLQGFGHIGELQQLIRKYPEANQDVKCAASLLLRHAQLLQVLRRGKKDEGGEFQLS